MEYFEQNLIRVLNNWYNGLSDFADEEATARYTFAKHKFKTFYLNKTGEFLKISQRTESAYFSKIADALSKKYTVDDALMNQYLEWCFENYDLFLKKYSGFNLNSILLFAENWSPDLYKFKEEKKLEICDLDGISIKDVGVFDCFENFGIALTATKLKIDLNATAPIIEKTIKEKLRTLTTKKEDLNRLKNMLRVTVENSPYSSEIIFRDFKESLKEFFIYFNGESWAK